MTVNIAAIDDTVLALYLTLHDRDRAWKIFDWDALRRLYEQGMNDDSFNEVKSVLTEEGLRKSERLFKQHVALVGGEGSNKENP